MHFALSSPVSRVLREYSSKIRLFKPNARLYLINVIFTGASMGVFRLIFNFYVLSLGYNEAVLGNLVTTSSMTSLLAALPMGYLSDRLGRKASLIISGVMMSLSVFMMVLFPFLFVLYSMNIVLGAALSLSAVTMSPFLMENSGETERTYLFSFGVGLQTVSGSVGNWIGGYLPTWIAISRNTYPTSSIAYGSSLLAIGLSGVLGLIPLALMRMKMLKHSERTVFAPISYARKNPVTLGKLVLPMLLTSIGAGLIMPFMNVFFRQVHHQPDQVIGSLFAWGSLAMGIGLIIAPVLADRMGKIQLVVITQGLSIPFLVLLGFAPWFWMSAASYYIRLALMNMSSPVYDTFVMEHVEAPARAMVASLVNMSATFGWAFSPTISGLLQVRYGFGPPFIGTIILYIFSVVLYWSFFWRKSSKPIAVLTPGD